MELPILTKELAAKIEHVDFLVMRDRMRAIQLRAGNPNEVEMKSFGGATALSAKDMPVAFNKVWGFGKEELPLLDEIIRFYQERHLSFAMDVTPVSLDEEMAAALHAKGLYQQGFHTAFYGVPLTWEDQRPNDIVIKKASLQEMELFSRLFHESLEVPSDIPENAESFSILNSDPAWSLYIGCLHGRPAAFSMLYVSDDGIACFGMAGTLPAFRGKGLQTAMLHRRMADAKGKGCRLVVAQSEYGTSSFHNLQRIGMRVAYTKALWIFE